MDLLSEIERPDPADEEKRERRFRLVASVGIVGLSLVGVTTLATGALFTDQDTLPGAITAGTVRLDATAPVAITSPVSGLAPGDTLTRSITVTNTGSLGQVYGAETAGTGTLAPALTMQWSWLAATDACDSTTLLANSAGVNSVQAVAASRTLAAGDSEQLCFRVTFTDTGLPAPSLVAADQDGDNVYQGATADLTFTFTAQQRAPQNF